MVVYIIIAIIDLSDSKVLHITYPQGYKLNKSQLDPNIGNFFDPKDSYKRIEAKRRAEALDRAI